MAKGKTHDKFNYLVGTILSGVFLGLGIKWWLVSTFCLGWFFSTLIFSPDLDLGPKKRAFLLAPFLYPYSLFFKHRGLSHIPLLGTISRVFYGILIFIIMIFVLSEMGYLPFTAGEFWSSLCTFLLNYDYQKPAYQLLTWPFIGLVGADLSHIFLDHLSSTFSRVGRFFSK